MNAFLKRIGTIIVAVLLIIATGGYSVYRHYCQTEGRTLVSVFTEKLCDHDYLQEMPSCCSLPAETPAETSHCQSKSDCCHTSLTFLKISDLFTFKIDLSSVDFVVAFIQEMDDETNMPAAREPKVRDFTADIPPPIAGKELLITTHQLKIAPDLA